jgi:predicted metal-dependent HD superfamily phosphohydrolase
VNYIEAHRYVVNRLEGELSDDLVYHGLHHTLDVIETTELIAKSEGLSLQEITMVKTAALYHDTGFIFEYENNERLAIDLAQETLPEFGYTYSEIEIISGMIEATISHIKPRNHWEQIMVDADFDYFGREDFEAIAETLYKELIKHGTEYSAKQWDEVQMLFLQKHRYYTNFSIENRLPIKQKSLSKLIERLSKY